MSSPLCCNNCGNVISTTAVPGSEGQSAFTTVGVGGVGSFVVPALAAQVTIPLENTDWMAEGNGYFIGTAGYFLLDTILSPTSATFTYLNIAANISTGNTIPAGTAVVAGSIGADGTDGSSVFTLLTAPLPNVTAIGDQVSATVSTNVMFDVGQTVFIADPSPGTDHGTFTVISKTGTTVMLVEFLGATGDTAPPFIIGTGGQVTATGAPFSLAGPLPTALTNNSTGTPGATIAVGSAIQTLEFPHTFIGGTAAVEPVTTYVVGFKFKIISWDFVTEVLLVGAAGSRVANMEINATDVGTVPSTITIPIANAAVGTVTNGTAVAGANTGSATDTFSIEIAAGGTAFTAGSGTFVVRVMNMDLADSISSLNASISTLITDLT